MRNLIFCTLLLIFFNYSLISEPLNKNFKFSKSELINILKDEPEPRKNLIIENSSDFLNKIDKILNDDSSYLVLVDKTHRLTKNYIPKNLVNLTTYGFNTRFKEMLFIKSGIEDFKQMVDDALLEGADLFIASTYRTYEFQNQIFNNMKNYHGEEKAATIVAYPGASQHQLGTGVDFGSITPSFAYTKEGIWLLKNAWKYGFSLSYPEGLEQITTYMWEPWHYRYIGKIPTLLQKEYFNDIQQDFLVFWDKYNSFFKKNHIH